MITCPHCNHDKAHKRGFNSNRTLQIYRCLNCKRKYTIDSKPKSDVYPREIKKCLSCDNLTDNPKFCSSSCAAKYNNRYFPKRIRRERHCKYCAVVIPHGRTVCDNCNPSYVDWTKRTIGDVRRSAKYQVNAEVRDAARTIYAKSGLPYVCRNCGYDKHVEICHIKAIKDFSADTPVSVVNDVSNLVALCPNCHWELDRGLLVL